MCGVETLAVATLALGATQALMGGIASEQQAQAQNAYQKAQAAEYARVAELNNRAAAQEYVNQAAAESIQQMQEQAATSRQTQEAQKAALERQGTMAASTNAAGGAFNALMADFERQAASQKDAIREQYEMQGVSHALNTTALKERAQNRINSQGRYIAAPVSGGGTMNFLSTALGIGAAGLKAGDIFMSCKNREPNPLTPVPKGGKP